MEGERRLCEVKVNRKTATEETNMLLNGERSVQLKRLGRM